MRYEMTGNSNVDAAREPGWSIAQVARWIRRHKIKIDENGCWVFTGFKLQGGVGYGQIRVQGKIQVVHRVMWTDEKGPIPPGLLVLHYCDNKPCCNTKHLHLGTHADNIKEATLRGQRRWLKLSLEQAEEIRQRFATGEIRNRLATEYGVKHSTIKFIVERRGYNY